jgi:hypothetical protein
MVANKTLYTLSHFERKLHKHCRSSTRSFIYIEAVRAKNLYTLAARYENSIYIEPSLGHNESSSGA